MNPKAYVPVKMAGHGKTIAYKRWARMDQPSVYIEVDRLRTLGVDGENWVRAAIEQRKLLEWDNEIKS